MAHSAAQPAFPLLRALVVLTAAAGGLLALALLAVPYFFGSSTEVRQAALLAVAAVWVTALFSAGLVALLGPWGLMPTVYAFFAGMTLRMLLCLGAAWAGELFLGLPGRPLAASLAIAYMPLLAIEIAFVGRYLWNKDFLKSTPPAQAGATAEVTA